ncbi:MbnP family protein [Sphingobacterium sp. N143]|uniref:MbnP family protein n=1 Tax=Sphingobacterium sp. N143 TaxID=2746727 RepID=UPI002576FA6A|nr:MbnP family protein [Sphingobacterium sp. N143]
MKKIKNDLTLSAVSTKNKNRMSVCFPSSRLLRLFQLMLIALVMAACSKDNDKPVANNISLHFNNTFKNSSIVLGEADSPTATANTSANGQVHHFSELKYVISNIRLVKIDGTEIPYHVNDLDKGATVVNQAKLSTLDYMLADVPVGEYKQIKFGFGIKQGLNTLDQFRFPIFYGIAEANDTEMMWQWATGYRFAKIEGFYESDQKKFTIHTGSTLNGKAGQPDTYVQGVDAYRDITLDLNTALVVGGNKPEITIKADFDKLFSGKNKITIDAKYATAPQQHEGMEVMVEYVNNMGGDGQEDRSGMFSIQKIEN